jgi:hypothetical protein
MPFPPDPPRSLVRVRARHGQPVPAEGAGRGVASLSFRLAPRAVEPPPSWFFAAPRGADFVDPWADSAEPPGDTAHAHGTKPRTAPPAGDADKVVLPASPLGSPEGARPPKTAPPAVAADGRGRSGSKGRALSLDGGGTAGEGEGDTGEGAEAEWVATESGGGAA